MKFYNKHSEKKTLTLGTQHFPSPNPNYAGKIRLLPQIFSIWSGRRQVRCVSLRFCNKKKQNKTPPWFTEGWGLFYSWIAFSKFHPLKSIFLEIGNLSYHCPRFPFELLRISLETSQFKYRKGGGSRSFCSERDCAFSSNLLTLVFFPFIKAI